MLKVSQSIYNQKRPQVIYVGGVFPPHGGGARDTA